MLQFPAFPSFASGTVLGHGEAVLWIAEIIQQKCKQQIPTLHFFSYQQQGLFKAALRLRKQCSLYNQQMQLPAYKMLTFS